MKNKLINSLSILSLCMCMGAAHAAIKCDFENKEDHIINPDYTLCTVHAYNVGLDQNPLANSETRAMMDEVVKLKSTVIAQQMKRQYDYLDATIKRFETQLQKAVLVSKLEAAGAAPSQSSASYGGGGASGAGLAGVEPYCMTKGDRALDCLLDNNTKLLAAVATSGDLRKIRDQMTADFKSYSGISATLGSFATAEDKFQAATCKANTNLSRKEMEECLRLMSADIAGVKANEKRANQAAGVRMF